MKRLLALAVALAAGGAATADIPPPPGFKRIPVENRIAAEKTFPEYLLFAVSGGGPGSTVAASPLALDPKAPVEVPLGTGRFRSATLVAVPKDAAKGYATEKEFLAAVAGGKVEGMLKAKTGFGGITEVKITDTRKTAVKVFKLESIDPKDGIVLKPAEAKDAPKNAPEEESDDLPPDGRSALAPPGGTWIAGLAAFAGVALAGLWVARRGR